MVTQSCDSHGLENRATYNAVRQHGACWLTLSYLLFWHFGRLFILMWNLLDSSLCTVQLHVFRLVYGILVIYSLVILAWMKEKCQVFWHNLDHQSYVALWLTDKQAMNTFLGRSQQWEEFLDIVSSKNWVVLITGLWYMIIRSPMLPSVVDRTWFHLSTLDRISLVGLPVFAWAHH